MTQLSQQKKNTSTLLTPFPSTVSLFHRLSVDTSEVFRGDYLCRLIQLSDSPSYPEHQCIQTHTHNSISTSANNHKITQTFWALRGFDFR